MATTNAARPRGLRLLARDIMTTPVITARPETTVKDLAAIMTTHRISGVPIVNEELELVGIVTEGDLLYKEVLPRPAEPSRLVRRLPLRGVLRAEEQARKAEAARAFEIMTSPVLTVAETATVHEIAQVMVAHGINRVVVMRAGRVAGIVSRADVLKAFRRPDAELAELIRQSFQHDLWIDLSDVTVEVRDGVVFLDGTVERRSERELAEKWAAMADGVVEVRNRLSYRVDDAHVRPILPVR
ncbi:MAG: CBS domain-containing protein [Armatimonadota bacterium]|nr:CBS domain-containing protein [Armatimonadota bacterium]MDR7422274.1 CBS domain-containing protein [Armatimonadota bacterium]MDR7453775.1 CBS domain-containing protein [Armatimonadota bacterium]MDR7456303.1 CBS domain-containing protein [Armatimonadota bacterium]MDR7496300.1 CBS domain-containing protein [Armatimonadota bacterium]